MALAGLVVASLFEMCPPDALAEVKAYIIIYVYISHTFHVDIAVCIRVYVLFHDTYLCGWVGNI